MRLGTCLEIRFLFVSAVKIVVIPNFSFLSLLVLLHLGLELLDVDLGSSEKAKAQGWDLDRFQIRSD